jgi:hypothetical protein
MNYEALKAGLRRFGKAFVAAGIAQVVIVIGPGLSFSTLADLKTVASMIVFAFITGGLMGIHKMLDWKDNPSNENLG